MGGQGGLGRGAVDGTARHRDRYDRTFQAITLFGTGDPKMMASGISEALVTTMLGLYVAIPLVLLHALVSNTSKGVVEVLEEQAAGLIARRAEQRDAT